MSTWFTSDSHFFHRNVIKYCNRPFYGGLLNKLRYKLTGKVSDAAVREMNEELIKRHNAVVRPGDTVYHLGDFSLWKHGVTQILPRLNGEHHLIAGNHDWCHPVQAKTKLAHWQKVYQDAGFKSISLEMDMQIIGERVTLHHMPFYNPNPDFDQRYPQWRPRDIGQFLLHGHVHEKWQVKGRMINVGVDQWNFTPVSLEQIETLIYSIKKEEEYNAIHKK